MKHLLSILLICSIGFTQELTVEGNLNVTGNIQNQTIDSLLQVIQDLQSQLSDLQGGLTNRVITLENIFLTPGSNGEDFYEINFQEIFGQDLDYAIVSLLNIEYVSGTGETVISLNSADLNIHSQIAPNGTWSISNSAPLLYNNNFNWGGYFDNNLYFYCGTTVTFNVTLSITTQFPN